MSGSFESVRWNACVHRLDLGLYSHPKEFFVCNGVTAHGNSKGKNLLYRKTFSSEEDRTHDTASSRAASPTHYNELFRPPNSNTLVRKCFGGMKSEPMFTPREIPSLPGGKNLGGGSNPRRYIKRDSESNTLPKSYSSPGRCIQINFT